MNRLNDPDSAGLVLAVDDCAAMREIMCASLQRLGYSVMAVDSGWAALDAVSTSSFDAIVLDVEMPGLDGMAVGRALRSNPQTASAPIAMHSSIDEAAVRTGFSGYDTFVSKAAGPRSLGEQVDRLIRSRRTAASALARAGATLQAGTHESRNPDPAIGA